MQVIDLMGKKFGSLTVFEGPIRRIVRGISRVFWTCRCSCGEMVIFQSQALSEGSSCRSCRSKKMKILKSNLKHGMRHTRTYKIWIGMKNRCTNTKNYSYAYYGGRGIKISEKWMTFEGFLEDMGVAPEKQTIDRIDCNGDYCKENCRWATRKTQSHNSSQVVNITYAGETRCITEWARCIGVHRSTIERRMAKGWPIDRVLKPGI